MEKAPSDLLEGKSRNPEMRMKKKRRWFLFGFISLPFISSVWISVEDRKRLLDLSFTRQRAQMWRFSQHGNPPKTANVCNITSISLGKKRQKRNGSLAMLADEWEIVASKKSWNDSIFECHKKIIKENVNLSVFSSLRLFFSKLSDFSRGLVYKVFVRIS